MKYKNIKELKAAYDSGKLDRDNVLFLDNDSSSVYVEGKCVFKSSLGDLLCEVLDELNIPSEGV